MTLNDFWKSFQPLLGLAMRQK